MNALLAIIVMLNGQAVEFKDAKPFVEAGRVMVPLRETFEKMGAKVDYGDATAGISVRRKWGILRRDILTTIDGKKVYVSEWKPAITPGRFEVFTSSFRVETPPRLRTGHVFVPLRFIAEALDAKVQWQSDTHEVLITTKDEKPSTPPAIKAGEIEVGAKSDKSSYRAGETVKFTVTAINQDDRRRTLNFRAGQSFDITITPTNQDEAIWRWDWSHDRMFTQALREKVLKPGETLSFEATWNQQDNDGKQMPRGEYSVEARLTSEKPVVASLIIITLAD